MSWLRVQDLHIVVGDRPLIQGATFRIDPGDRIGLVGPNGMGKTTLFRVLRGEILADGGLIERGPGLSITALDQLHVVGASTVYETALGANAEIPRLESQLRELERQMADPSCPHLDTILDQYAQDQERYQSLGGYEWDVHVRQALSGLGLDESRWQDNPEALSGGERHRLSLAQVLLSGSNVWFLDEPTNHLDVEAIEWLERTLLAFRGGILMASHDRRFLERTATRIMSWEDGFFWMAAGSYRQYLALREERLKQLADRWQRHQEERARLSAYVERYRAGNRATQAKSRLHAIARLDKAAPKAPTSPAQTERLIHRGQELSGTLALNVHHLTVVAGSRTWPPLTFKLPAKARLAIVGPNGCGKTSLLRALVASAEGVRWHPDARLSWYDQEAASLLPEHLTGLELAYEEGWDREAAYYLSARFGLNANLLTTRVQLWSGGERSRLALLFALMAPASVLLLDEPTNHLDLPMREELESLLQKYPGALLMVSHDREFLDNVSTHTLNWDEGHFTFRPGRYSAVVAR